MSLVLEPPDELPAELAATVAADELRGVSQRSRRAIVPFIALFVALIPSRFMLGVHSRPLFLALLATPLLMIGLATYNWRIRPVPVALMMSAHLVLLVLVSQLAGPFVITPIAVCAVLMSATQLPWVNERPWFVLGWTTLAVLAPFLLDALGVFVPTTALTPGGLLVHGNVFENGKGSSLGFLAVIDLVALLVIALYVRRIGHDRRVAQRRLQVQAWHLRQLLPSLEDPAPFSLTPACSPHGPHRCCAHDQPRPGPLRLVRAPHLRPRGRDRVLHRGPRLEDPAVRVRRLHDVGRRSGPARWRDAAPRGGEEDGRAAVLAGERPGRERRRDRRHREGARREGLRRPRTSRTSAGSR